MIDRTVNLKLRQSCDRQKAVLMATQRCLDANASMAYGQRRFLS